MLALFVSSFYLMYFVFISYVYLYNVLHSIKKINSALNTISQNRCAALHEEGLLYSLV